MILSYIDAIVEELQSDSEIHFQTNAYEFIDVPTLQANSYRKASPQLLAIYNRISSWVDSTHGDWLSIDEMKQLWCDDCANERISSIKSNICSAASNWCNDARSLYNDERISLFAGSAYTFERVYLIWFDSEIEPEAWVYDANGFARYKTIECYLKAFIADDLTAYSNSSV